MGVRTCELEGCGAPFESNHPHQRFCSVAHRTQAAVRRRRYGRAVTIESALASAEDRDHRLEEARQLRQLTAAESRLRRYESVLERAIVGHEPTPLVDPRDRSEHRPSHEWVLSLSDWHTGQLTRIEETGGMYHQDVSTVRRQVAKIWEALRWVHQIESHGRKIERLHILSLGDLVDNDSMRPSQHRKVEDVITVQTVQAFDILVWFVRQCLTIFERVEIDLVGGNHDRLNSSRPGDAGLGELDYVDTVSYLIGAFLERSLAADVESDRLAVKNWQTFFGYKAIADQRGVCEHGSSFKWSVGSYGGVPWYGIQRAGAGYESMLGGADIVCLGHGHRPAVIPNGRGWIVVNGALPATSTFSQSAFKTMGRPLQWLLSVHREMGLTGFLPLYADVEGQLLPGEIWEDPERYSALATGSRG